MKSMPWLIIILAIVGGFLFRLISFTVGEAEQAVVLEFGKSIRWLAMPPAQAVEVGEMLVKKAHEQL